MDAVSLSPRWKRKATTTSITRASGSRLDSTADEPTTRRVIVRVEQIFAAYRQMLPPRGTGRRAAAAGRLQLDGAIPGVSCPAGRADPEPRLLPRRAKTSWPWAATWPGWPLRMAKVNRPDRRDPPRVEATGETLQDAAGREWPTTCRKEGRAAGEIKPAEATIKRQFDADVKAKKKELDRCERQAAQVFQDGTRQVFARIYHETFHAYLENCVLSARDSTTCRAGSTRGWPSCSRAAFWRRTRLRVDAPNAAALKRLKADLSGPQPLASGETAGDRRRRLPATRTTPTRPASDRLYAYAWGLAYYLAFEKHLLEQSGAWPSTSRRRRRSSRPSPRFERLVGMPLGQFERQWREYILSLHQGQRP